MSILQEFDWIGSILIPILSTAVGAMVAYRAVKWTVQAETEREKRNQEELKKSLILGIGAELKEIYRYISQIGALNYGGNYVLESRIVEDTVSDQLKLFNTPNLVERLSHLRLILKRINQGTEVLRHPFVTSASTSPQILKDWEMYKSNCLDTTKEIVGLLDIEAPGLLGKEMDTVRNG